MTPRRRCTISTMILLGYTAMLVAVASLGWYATEKMKELQAINHDLYFHPFAVSNAAANLKGSLFQLRNHMVQIVLIRNQADNLEKMSQEAESFEQQVRTDLSVIKASFLGDMARVAELEQKFDQWNRIRLDILAAAQRGDFGSAEQQVRLVGTPKFAELVPLVDYVLSFARERGKGLLKEAEVHSAQIVEKTQALILVLVFFVMSTAAIVFWRVRYLQTELDRQATTDYLTEIPNRRRFMELTEREHSRSRRYENSFALAVVDLDWFKTINDKHGHQAGDEVLKRFCEIAIGALRDSDILGRIGGEEFAILLPNTSIGEAREVVERVRKAIESAEIEIGSGVRLRLTGSFGLSEYSPEKDMTTIFRLADEALYHAKNSGRNQVRIARSEA